MIDYDKPDADPVVAEVRRIREEIAAEYNYDLVALCDAMMKRQATSRARYATPADRAETSGHDSTKKVG